MTREVLADYIDLWREDPLWAAVLLPTVPFVLLAFIGGDIGLAISRGLWGNR